MDGERFDALSRFVAGSRSRRGLLKAAAALLLGVGTSRTGSLRPASATSCGAFGQSCNTANPCCEPLVCIAGFANIVTCGNCTPQGQQCNNINSVCCSGLICHPDSHTCETPPSCWEFGYLCGDIPCCSDDLICMGFCCRAPGAGCDDSDDCCDVPGNVLSGRCVAGVCSGGSACIAEGDLCVDDTGCCNDMNCFHSPGALGYCTSACVTQGNSCHDTGDCCTGLICDSGFCAVPCIPLAGDCSAPGSVCCEGTCFDDVCTLDPGPVCALPGASCSTDPTADPSSICCAGLLCTSGTCEINCAVPDDPCSTDPSANPLSICCPGLSCVSGKCAVGGLGSTPTSTATSTPGGTATATETGTSTATATATEASTSTATATATEASTSTATATATEASTSTATATATEASTSTATATATEASTSTSTATATPTRTASPAVTLTASPTHKPTETVTRTSTPPSNAGGATAGPSPTPGVAGLPSTGAGHRDGFGAAALTTLAAAAGAVAASLGLRNRSRPTSED